MKKLLLTVAACGVLAAGAANAATMIIDYDEQGTTLPNGTFAGVDLVGGGSDYNDTDGTNDIYFGENPSGTSAEFGVDTRPLFFGIEQFGDIARDQNGNILTFQDGDSIDGSHFQDAFLFSDTANLYSAPGSTDPGLIPNSGDTVVLGFRFTIADIFGCYVEEAEEVCDGPFQLNEEGQEQFVGDGPLDAFEILGEYYGFFQVTRGSVIPGTLGFNRSEGQAAIVALPDDEPQPVPLPAAGWLLLASLGGLGAMRRRKKS